jgi:cobalt-precorrin-5B (C1)-methyltransferase
LSGSLRLGSRKKIALPDIPSNMDFDETMDYVIDPVTKFSIPIEWIKRSKDPQALEKIRSGQWVLLSDGKMLRRGYTTGTTSSAACKGAIISLGIPSGEKIDVVDVMTPAGIRVALPVQAYSGLCCAIKDSGDHQFDITQGLEIVARAAISDKVELIAGKGIGRIAGRGLCAPPGKPAISQSAYHQIMHSIHEGLEIADLKGAVVELIVPHGLKIAALTLNPKIGVIDGISILGSTGFVEPWNDHLGDSRAEEIKELKKVLVTTGRTGLRFSRILFPDHQVVLMGSQLSRIEFGKDQDSILCGLPALILKWACPGILEGTNYSTVAEMVEMQPQHPSIDKALEKVQTKLPFTRIVLLQRDGRILRDTKG